MFFALLAFLVYNWHPAKVFPGDALTYSTGAVIACVAILGNMERIALALFTLYFFEFLIKVKTGFKGECFGIPDENGILSPPKKGVESLTHVIMRFGRFKESGVVLILLGIQAVIGLLIIIFML
jgi:UDP-N-acetylglucosamine--dolichyl-phosphate N-acetylglucosaminephosphotransferase